MSFFSQHIRGIVLVGSALLLVALVSGAVLQPPSVLFLPGDIATRSVAAEQELWVEDVHGMAARRARTGQQQPVVFDLSMKAYSHLETEAEKLFTLLGTAQSEERESIRWRIAEEFNREIALSLVAQWEEQDFQEMFSVLVLPWVRKYMQRGVVFDASVVRQHSHGIIIRNTDTGKESTVVPPETLVDLSRMYADLAAFLKQEIRQPFLVRNAVLTIVSTFSSATLVRNFEETQRRRTLAMESLEPEYLHIQKNEIIVRQGEVVSPQQHLKLQTLASREADWFDEGQAAGVFVLSALLMSGLFVCMYTDLFRTLRTQDFFLLSFFIVLFGLGARLLAFVDSPFVMGSVTVSSSVVAFVVPMAGAAGVMALFFPLLACLFTILTLSCLCAFLLGGGLELFLFYCISGMVEMFAIKRTTSRKTLLLTVFPLLCGMLAAWAGVMVLSSQTIPYILTAGVFTVAGGVLSLLFILAVSPIMEMLFGYTSTFRLMELMSLEQPLLQRLMVEAPGTYHHSLILSHMAEAGARAIGANALRAKVAALYHDIGKLSKPEYFIENQRGGENRHDKLAPSMSALILISHVKQGMEMARANKLGEKLCDLIQQHHGTLLISYFHHKAMEQAGKKGDEAVRALSEEEFRYPGPKPQTKEAGLLLVADAIEASSRTLNDPTPSRIKGHVQTIIRNIFTDGQLDESELTLKDLHRLEEVFSHMLTGLFHTRIEYPETGTGQHAEDTTASAAESAPEHTDSGTSSDRKNILQFDRQKGLR